MYILLTLALQTCKACSPQLFRHVQSAHLSSTDIYSCSPQLSGMYCTAYSPQLFRHVQPTTSALQTCTAYHLSSSDKYSLLTSALQTCTACDLSSSDMYSLPPQLFRHVQPAHLSTSDMYSCSPQLFRHVLYSLLTSALQTCTACHLSSSDMYSLPPQLFRHVQPAHLWFLQTCTAKASSPQRSVLVEPAHLISSDSFSLLSTSALQTCADCTSQLFR
jgi:hypothetical protein